MYQYQWGSSGVRLWIGVLAAAVFGMAGCTGVQTGPSETETESIAQGTAATEAGANGEDHLIIAETNDPRSLDPHYDYALSSGAITRNVYETLTLPNPSGEAVPLLAAEMPEQIDDVTWEIKVRQGVTFHNGEELDAVVVAANFERVLTDEDLQAESDLTQFWETFASAEAVDEFTVHVTTTTPDPLFPTRLLWLRIVPSTALESADTDLREEAIGTGPYKFVEWRRGESILLERNDEYWGDAPSIATAEIRIIPEASSRMSSLLAEEVHIAARISSDDIARAPQGGPVQAKQVAIVNLNAEDGITADERVRQALSMAIDREALEGLFGDGTHTDVIHQPLAPSWFGYHEGIDEIPYDPAQAQEILEEAGVLGEPIEIVTLQGYYNNDHEMTQAIASNWAEVGLDAQITVLTREEFAGTIFEEDPTQRPDALWVQASNDFDDADKLAMQYLTVDGRTAWNQDTEISSLVEEAHTASSSEDRQNLYAEAMELNQSRAYVVPLLAVPSDWYAMSDSVVGEPRGRFMIISDFSLDN